MREGNIFQNQRNEIIIQQLLHVLFILRQDDQEVQDVMIQLHVFHSLQHLHDDHRVVERANEVMTHFIQAAQRANTERGQRRTALHIRQNSSHQLLKQDLGRGVIQSANEGVSRLQVVADINRTHLDVSLQRIVHHEKLLIVPSNWLIQAFHLLHLLKLIDFCLQCTSELESCLLVPNQISQLVVLSDDVKHDAVVLHLRGRRLLILLIVSLCPSRSRSQATRLVLRHLQRFRYSNSHTVLQFTAWALVI
mmetsp:Transcript_25805/g.48436  ORF Transcript_25805/g.48436 Transcript_25805/m.48436 type:complete len:250 (-) Transcript_25805:66-815(-)